MSLLKFEPKEPKFDCKYLLVELRPRNGTERLYSRSIR